MSTVRIQNRRGLASEWVSVNPILAEGEQGLETDTNLIKFGNGSDNWLDLPYANVTATSFANTIADYVLLADVGQPNGVASLNSSGKVPSSQLDVVELSQDAVANALVAGSNVVLSYDDPANHITVSVDNSITLTGDLTVGGDSTVEALTVNGNLTVNGTTTTVSTANFTTEDALIYIGEDNQANSVDLGIVASFNDGTYQHSGLVRDASDGVWKLFSGVVPEPGTTVDFTTHTKDALEVGSLSATNASIGNVSNQEIQYLDGVTSAIQTQLDSKQDKVTNVSDVEISFLDGVTSSIQTQLDSKQNKLSNVSDTEIGYLDGVTSSIQTQIDAKLNSVDATATYAPISSPTFTGTVYGITKEMVGLGNADNTSDANKPISTATQTALDLKLNTADAASTYAPIAAPTFTGTVVLPETTSIGTVSATEIGYVDGVTSSIQTQLNTSATNLSNHSSATTSVHGISDTANLVYTDDSRLSDTRTPTDNTVSEAKIVDGAVTSAKIADETIVNGDISASAAIAQSKISGLTSDLAAKAALAGATFTGDITVPNITISGNLTVNGTTTSVTSTNLEVSDPLIYVATGNSANTKDIGIVGHFNNGTYQHTGIVRDATDGKWKLFSGVTTEPSDTIDFSTPTYDTLVVGGIEFSDGAQTKQGVPSITPIISKTSSYTLSDLSERDSMIEVSSSSATTITIPTNSAVAFPIGASIDISQISTGQVTIAGDTGVTVNATPGLKLRTQWSTATLFKRGTNSWLVYGDLTA